MSPPPGRVLKAPTLNSDKAHLSLHPRRSLEEECRFGWHVQVTSFVELRPCPMPQAGSGSPPPASVQPPAAARGTATTTTSPAAPMATPTPPEVIIISDDDDEDEEDEVVWVRTQHGSAPGLAAGAGAGAGAAAPSPSPSPRAPAAPLDVRLQPSARSQQAAASERGGGQARQLGGGRMVSGQGVPPLRDPGSSCPEQSGGVGGGAGATPRMLEAAPPPDAVGSASAGAEVRAVSISAWCGIARCKNGNAAAAALTKPRP